MSNSVNNLSNFPGNSSQVLSNPGSSATKNSNSSSHQSHHYSLEKNILQCYHEVFHRYQLKRDIYGVASRYYNRLELWIFIMPNIIIQLANTVLPLFLYDNEKYLKIIVSTLAAVSAIWLGLASKLRLGKTAETFKTMSNTCKDLAKACFYKIKEEQFSDLNESYEQKRIKLQTYLEFCEQNEKFEKLANTSNEFVPLWIQNKVKKMKRINDLEKVVEKKERLRISENGQRQDFENFRPLVDGNSQTEVQFSFHNNHGSNNNHNGLGFGKEKNWSEISRFLSL